MTTNNNSIERSVTKGRPQGADPAFGTCFTSHIKVIAFADDLIILTKGESIVETENYMNLEWRKISDWAQNNKLKFK